jgi:hypothetical protein
MKKCLEWLKLRQAADVKDDAVRGSPFLVCGSLWTVGTLLFFRPLLSVIKYGSPQRANVICVQKTRDRERGQL